MAITSKIWGYLGLGYSYSSYGDLGSWDITLKLNVNVSAANSGWSKSKTK